MKNHSLLASSLLVAGLIALTSAAVSPTPGFSDGTLRGRYVFQLDGDLTVGPLLGPASAVGYIEFDGHGNIPIAKRTLNIAGQVILQDDTASGSYLVNPDGSGSATFVNASNGAIETFDFTIVDRQRLWSVVTTPGFVGSGPAERQKHH